MEEWRNLGALGGTWRSIPPAAEFDVLLLASGITVVYGETLIKSGNYTEAIIPTHKY
jgi:hypothetical protein